jgi:signal transduction histidine kinase
MVNRIFFLFMLLGLVPIKNTAQDQSRINFLKSRLNATKGSEQFSILVDLSVLYAEAYPDSSIYFGNQAFEIGQKIGIREGLARPLSAVGLAYENKGDLRKSLDYHERAIEISVLNRDSVQLGYCYNYLGQFFLDGGNASRAIEHFSNAGKIFVLKKDASGQIEVLKNLALAHSQQREHTLAIQEGEKAYYLIIQQGDTLEQVLALIELGSLYQAVGKGQEAIARLDQALKIAAGRSDKALEAEALIGLSEVYFENQDFVRAREALKRVFPEISSLRNEKLFGRACMLQAQLLMHDKNYKAAIGWLELLIKHAEQIGNLQSSESALELLITCHDAIGNTDRSAMLEQKLADLVIKIKDEDLMREAERLNFELMVGKSDTENQILKSENEINRSLISEIKSENVLLIILLIAFVIVVISMIVLLRTRSQANKKLAIQNQQILAQQKIIREANEKLEHRNTELQDLSNEMDSLLSVVAHDLKSPLNQISGFIQLVELEGTLNDAQKDHINRLRTSIKQGVELITNILDVNYYRHSVQKPVPAMMNLEHFVSDIRHSFSIIAEKKNIHFKVNFSGKAEFFTVTDYISRIVNNLVSNAIKFSDPGSVVVFSLSATDSLNIIVRDSGPGFSESDKKYMFKQFRKLSARPTANESSTGLGLAIVKSLVDRLSGTIKLVSAPGEGAEFTVIIPESVQE